MDDLGLKLSQDALEDLNRLEQRAERLAQQQEEAARWQREAHIMTAKIQRLQQKRDKLRALVARKPKTVCDHIKESDKGVSGPQKRSSDDSHLLTLKQKRTKLQALFLSYRLTGIQVTVVDNKKVRFCFDTSYGGEFYEPYYVEVQLVPTPTVSRHTLPSFVPVSLLEQKLQADIQDFAYTTRSYLQAFVSRRQAVKDAYETYGIYMEEEPSATPTCDCVRMDLTNLTNLSGSLNLLLKYENRRSLFPTKVIIKSEDDPPDEMKENIDDFRGMLKTMDLVSSLDKFISEVNHL